jgi:hypothetical protein
MKSAFDLNDSSIIPIRCRAETNQWARTCNGGSTYEHLLSESKSSVHVGVSHVNYVGYVIQCRSKLPMEYFLTRLKENDPFILSVNKTGSVDKLQVVNLQTCYFGFFLQACKLSEAL